VPYKNSINAISQLHKNAILRHLMWVFLVFSDGHKGDILFKTFNYKQEQKRQNIKINNKIQNLNKKMTSTSHVM